MLLVAQQSDRLAPTLSAAFTDLLTPPFEDYRPTENTIRLKVRGSDWREGLRMVLQSGNPGEGNPLQIKYCPRLTEERETALKLISSLFI